MDSRICRRLIIVEILLVLGLSLGKSAIYSLVRLGDYLTANQALAARTTTLNPQVSPRPYLDLTYQLLGIFFALVPVALIAFFFISEATWKNTSQTVKKNEKPWDIIQNKLGLSSASFIRQVGFSAVLAALIGIPGLAFYIAGRWLGITVAVQASGLAWHWWTVPVLVLAAAQNAIVEEVIVVGYLTTRLRQLRWGPLAVIIISAVLRGSYHLYQGIGPGIGNLVMGIVFATWYHKTGKLWPLIGAHLLLDIFAFVGFAFLGSHWLLA